MTTIGRRLLHIAPRLGARVVDLWPGTTLLSRRTDVDTLPLGSDVTLVSRGVRRRRPAVTEMDSGNWLVSEPGGPRRDPRIHQRRLFNYLCVEHVAWMLRLYDVNCVLDVGANVGQYARELRKAGYTGRIASFEPLPHIVEKLEKAAADDGDWWVYPYALGRENSTLEMNVVFGTMSSILPPSEYGSSTFKRFGSAKKEQIEVRRLDSVLDDVLDGISSPRPYLKLDTQGYDLEAFAGAGSRISEFVGLQSEVALLRIYDGSPRMAESIAAYEEAGFEITGMFPITQEESTGRVLEFDCVMARASTA